MSSLVVFCAPGASLGGSRGSLELPGGQGKPRAPERWPESSGRGLDDDFLCKAGGKPSTRLPPGKLVEHFKAKSPASSPQPSASRLQPPASRLQPAASNLQRPFTSLQKARKRSNLTEQCLDLEVVILAFARALRPLFWSSGLPLTSWELQRTSGATQRRPRSTENDQT